MNVDCIKLTSYFGERHRVGGRFVADALLDLYGRHEIAASILLRGTEGFGLKHHLRTDRSLTLSEDLPLTAIAVDSRPRIEAVLGPTLELNRPGLVTLERARLLDGAGFAEAGFTAGAGLAAGAGLRAARSDLPGESKLTVYLGRQERVGRVPAFVAVCDLLHRRGVAGATALLGVDGTARGQRERARFFSRNAEVPMMLVAVGSGDRIGQVLPELGGLLRQPLVTLERVRVCKRDGRLLAPPAPLPAADEHGMALWHKLMIFSSEAALHRRPAGAPRHGPAPALRGDQRRHHPARNLGVPRRPPAARRPGPAIGPPRARGDHRDRNPGADGHGLPHHRRAHQRARARHQRDHPRPACCRG